MANSRKVILKGSERAMLADARSIGPTDPHQLIEISVVLRHRQPLPMHKENDPTMSHNDFAGMYGADPSDVDRIRQFASENNLQMLERGDEVLRRTVTLAGTASAMEKAFSIELNEYEYPDGSYHGRTGPIQIQEDYAPYIRGVFGLDDRPVAKPHFRYRSTSGAFGVRTSNTSFTPAQVAKLYDFPEDANGAGQVIGIIELGGGYRPADIRQYFENLGLPAPAIKTASVDHGKNRPTTPQSADGEVMLDIEVAGTVAPGALIVVYFAPNTSRGFQDALSMAVHDQLHKPCVLSISWGGPENSWTQQSMQNFDEVAQEAGLLGITITASAGDNGSSDGVNDGKNHVDFPASCPHVLATGGTRLMGNRNSVTSETVWNDGTQGGATGGGFSAVFPHPAWQIGAPEQAGRGIPDVAGDADPDSGYNILVDGRNMVVGGTSAVAPLWAGLIALFNQKLNARLGYINPSMYAINQSDGFQDITTGNNGAYSAAAGWDPTTGLGSPTGNNLFQALQGRTAQSRVQQRQSSQPQT